MRRSACSPRRVRRCGRRSKCSGGSGHRMVASRFPSVWGWASTQANRLRHGGYRGAALNMAGRLVSAAGPGEALATERLVRLSGPVDGLHWSRPRSMRLKGLADPELVVQVEPDDSL